MPPQPEPTVGDTSWFVHDRFGLFIHWGIYAVAGRNEWAKSNERIPDEKYQEYFDHFDPDLYDPREWARLAKQAGMRYFVVTTKHHDGFCLWDSDLTDYKSTNTPARRDLIAPMVEAFRVEGLRAGFYHSLLDWHHPGFPVDGYHSMRDNLEFREREKHRDIRKYREYLHGQTRELLSRYGRLDIMWFDYSYSQMDWEWSKGKGKADWDSERLIAMVREHWPNVILNDRLEIGGDIKTPEQYQPRSWVTVDGKPVVWEACQTLNGSWGYDRDNLDWKPVDMLIRMLIDSVSKGGNMLLNVGPTARGEFDPRAQAALRGIGEWMRLHNRSIYGCTASDFTPPPDCHYTQNDNRLYLHVFTWPMRHLHLDGLAGRVEYAQTLNDGAEVKMQVASEHHGSTAPGQNTLTLTLPIQKPDVAVPVIELFLKG
ncbi:MAG: alpha-L-fucosidase [Armatimonadetes bacterium]|nr:alpha-L-fucosidase [Armatimonadota bacterium]